MMWRQPVRSLLLIALLFWGCAGSGPLPSYYTLQPPPDTDVHGKDPETAHLIIGMGPVVLPRYLDRDPIVTRISPNRLKVNERHRWAGSLQSDITRVLAARLGSLERVKEVLIFPWGTSIEPDLRFRVEILAFEGRPGKTVTLKAAWSMAPGSSDQPAVRRVSLIREEVNADSMEGMVAAMGNALTLLSREMAAAIAKASP
ncbi:MAG: PqiC family protein [Desulfobacteraceae bacterium]